MELLIWGIAGAALGWLAIAKMGMNEERGTVVSMIIGIAGGMLGGKLLAPMFGAVAVVPGQFSMAALVVVMATAAACLALGNLVHHRFGV